MLIRTLLAQHWDYEEQAKGVEDEVPNSSSGACCDKIKALQAIAVVLAVCLEDQATQDDCNARAKEELCPPIHLGAHNLHRRNDIQHTPVIEEVDDNVRDEHSVEEPPRVATWKVEDQHTQEHVQEDVCIATHV